MCGIAGVYLKNPEFVKRHDGLETFANALFLGIEPRGRRATGLVAVKPGGHGTHFEKADMPASEFIEAREPLPEGVRCLLLHTRYDTKGTPKNNKNNHPVLSGSTFVVHNGSVSNDNEIFREHKLERKAEVDSEAISAMIQRYGLDKSKFSLEKLKGNIAIAAIDPIRHPDKLVLAKGQSSPIEVFENKDFIVWASTRKAIEDAWGLVLGTPPKWNKFHTFKEGELWVVEGHSVTKQTFEVPRSYSYNSNRIKSGGDSKSHTCDDGGVSECGVDVGWGRSSWPSRETEREVQYPHRTTSTMNTPTTRDFRKEVAQREANGHGIARIMGQTDSEDLKGIGTAVWTRCSGCTRHVLREDMRPTFLWGRMCEDCYMCAIEERRDRYENPAKTLTEKERIGLNNWVKLEAMIHRKTLTALAEQVELEPDLIEWLIFRVPKTYLDDSKKINDLAADLDDLYQDVSAKLFKQHGIGDATSPAVLEQKSEVKRETRPFVVCSKHHSTYRQGDLCDKCAGRSDSPFTSGPPPSVKSHGRTILPCRVCENKNRKQPGRIRLGRFVFCNRHWMLCGNPTCISDNTNAKEGFRAVATSPDGTRLCHFCSRGQKGLLFDGTHDASGVTVEQL